VKKHVESLKERVVQQAVNQKKLSLTQRIKKTTALISATFSGIKTRFLQLGGGSVSQTPPSEDNLGEEEHYYGTENKK
jgi:hypothetical protein